MLFHPLSPTIPHIAYACLGGFVVLFGMFSLFIREKLYIGEACWAFLFGVIIGMYIHRLQILDITLTDCRSQPNPGPYGAGVFDPRSWANGNEQISNTITLEFTRVVLAIGVFAIGVELPKAYVARHWKSLFFLLGPVMTWGWFVSAGLIYAFIPGLDFLASLAVAACLTPTDPILAAAVVGGKYADKHVPAHIRRLLSAECGCNDGAAYPFLFIALYLILDSTPGHAVEDWFLFLWLFEIVLSVIFGSALGFAFRHLMKFCQRNDLIDRQSYVAQYVSLAFLTIGIMTILGSDDLLAAFCCGTAFAWDGFFNRQTEEAMFSSVIDLLFNVASFVYVGAWMPFDSFNNETLTLSVGRLILTAILILLLKRLPIMIALYKFIPDVKTFREALFSGHFGPVGIGAVYISTFAVGYLPKPSDPPANQAEFLASTIQPIVAFMVLCSVAIHGLSIPFFSLGRRVHSVSSRTWSRHASGPDWTTYTRHITRGEDVKKKTIMESRRTSTDFKDGSSKTEGTLRDGDETAKEQPPPDGADSLMEWKEGSDKIIERRAGPGEEVGLTGLERFIRHAYRREGSAPTDGPLQTARSYIRHLRHASEGTSKNTEQTGDSTEPDVSPAGAEMQKDPIITERAAAVTHTEGEPNDEEAWASEDNGKSTIAGPSAVRAPGERKKRVRSSKGKGVVKPAATGPHKKTRRRSSVSEQGRPSFRVRSPSLDATSPGMVNEPERTPDAPEDADRRGRSAQHAHERKSLSPRLARNAREASPSRSIRFADEHQPSTSTPRNSVIQNQY
ncbi:Sodium/hydrogen exchanger family-domain-containing protein [Boletus edulis]|nr:Sodium/hydrogen exchanger family-domain-containing protein [Boletus edulis]